MMIQIDDALRHAPANFERSHDAQWRRLGSNFIVAMGSLEEQDLGDGWSVKPGNTGSGSYRLALLKNGAQAAVFDETRDGLGDQILPDAHIHPLIDTEVAFDKLKLAIEVGLCWEKDPYAGPSTEPEETPSP